MGKVSTVKLGNAVNTILGSMFDGLNKDQLVTTFKGDAATILGPFMKMPLPLLLYCHSLGLFNFFSFILICIKDKQIAR